MSTPPLSSVQLAGEKIGYEAARILDRMMRRLKPPVQPTLFAPLFIETRRSSDIVAIDDEYLARAIRLIRQRACEGLTVNEILKVVPISRSTLERSCRRLLGRSPNEEIVRVRIEHVCILLRDTELSLDQIAARTGFSTSQYMLEVFRRTTGVTPGAYRRSHTSG
jgi:LacI family transcriptional regulator